MIWTKKIAAWWCFVVYVWMHWMFWFDDLNKFRNLKIGYSPYVNKAFVYVSVFKILNFIWQLFIFSCFYSIVNDQDTTIRLCKKIKWNKNLIKVFMSRQETPMCACADRTVPIFKNFWLHRIFLNCQNNCLY
jgi:hypothetical protein